MATTAVLNINNGMNTTIVLGSVGNASSPKESISVGIMMDTDYINMANNIINFIDNNGTAPSYVNDTYLDTSIRYESVVYIYSQILNTYNTTIGLPDYIPLIPWISVSNPNGIYNFRTQKVFSSIQAAIDENDTLNEDTIWLGKGPIIENVIVNKSLTITPIYENENVIVQALNLNLPVFTIEINGTGSIIRNLIINGSTNNAGIYIKSSNNTISGNNITGNLNGIYINNFINNEVLKNIISHNNLDGVCIYEGANNIVSDNIIEYNGNSGININSSENNKIHSNILSNNNIDGIYLYNSSTKVNFNRITENSRYGLYNEGNGTIDATNNWWGSNIIDPTDITGSTVNNESWLILNVISSCDRSSSNGTYYNHIITADLTHNNQGNDTSSDGNIPDEIPINFSTTLGTINTSLSTRGGKAVGILNGTSANIANVSATLDNKTVTIPVNVTGTTELGIYNIRNPNNRFSTIQDAIDNALDNDTILIENGTYTENIVITKKIIIKPASGSNVNIQSADGSSAVFTINSGGSGSVITGLIISEATDSYGINLDSASNCNITGNTIINNEIGIYLNYTMNNNISGNTIIDDWIGIYLDKSNNNNVTENTITNTWHGIYIEESNNNLITENTVTDNGGGIYLLNSNSTITSENNVINNTMADISLIDRTGIVMASDIYTCGPASLATVMNNLGIGINATEDELIEFSKTDLTGTTLYGLIQAAQKKNLIAKGLKLNWSELRTNNIVVLTIDGNTHFSIMTQISNNTVYLADTSLGNIEMTLEKFNEIYTGNALVVINNTNDEQLQLDNSKTISTPDTQKIKGKLAWFIPFVAAIVIRSAPTWGKALVRAGSYAWRGASTYLRKSFRKAPVQRWKSIPKTKRLQFKKHLQKTDEDMRNLGKVLKNLKKNKKKALAAAMITELTIVGANEGVIKGYIATSTYNNSSNTSNKKPNNILFYNVTNKSRWDVQYVPIK
ncbi:MAG: NosD domain-containing protein [Methanobacteriaceae archaeon]|nr:NosD domain-containing protein [Methanobacteriaceae archaeon]